MTPKQQLILAAGGVGAFLILRKGGGLSAASLKPKPVATKPTTPQGGTGGAYSTTRPNTTNLATQGGRSTVAQPPSTIARVLSGVSMGLKDIASLIGKSGQPVNARPAGPQPGGQPKPGGGVSVGGGPGGGGGATGRPQQKTAPKPPVATGYPVYGPPVPAGYGGYNWNAGIPVDSTPQYDAGGNLIGYDRGSDGAFVDLTTPSYDTQGNQNGYYDANGNYVSTVLDAKDPSAGVIVGPWQGPTEMPGFGSAFGTDDPAAPGLNSDGSGSTDIPWMEIISGDPSQGFGGFDLGPQPDYSLVTVDAPIDQYVAGPSDPGMFGPVDDSYGAGTTDSSYVDPSYDPNADYDNSYGDFY